MGTSSDGLVARAVQSAITSTDAEDEGFAQVERMRDLGLLG
jgi:hypothetical protein